MQITFEMTDDRPDIIVDMLWPVSVDISIVDVSYFLAAKKVEAIERLAELAWTY